MSRRSVTGKVSPRSPNGAARGFLPAARAKWRWVEMPQDEGADGEPFRAEIRCNLTFGEIDAIDVSGGLTFEALWRRMAAHVRAWNLLAFDHTAGEVAEVPPPATAGPDAFRALDHVTALWLAAELRLAHLGGEERGKGSPAPAPSAEPESGDDSD